MRERSVCLLNGKTVCFKLCLHLISIKCAHRRCVAWGVRVGGTEMCGVQWPVDVPPGGGQDTCQGPAPWAAASSSLAGSLGRSGDYDAETGAPAGGAPHRGVAVSGQCASFWAVVASGMTWGQALAPTGVLVTSTEPLGLQKSPSITVPTVVHEVRVEWVLGGPRTCWEVYLLADDPSLQETLWAPVHSSCLFCCLLVTHGSCVLFGSALLYLCVDSCSSIESIWGVFLLCVEVHHPFATKDVSIRYCLSDLFVLLISQEKTAGFVGRWDMPFLPILTLLWRKFQQKQRIVQDGTAHGVRASLSASSCPNKPEACSMLTYRINSDLLISSQIQHEIQFLSVVGQIGIHTGVGE